MNSYFNNPKMYLFDTYNKEKMLKKGCEEQSPRIHKSDGRYLVLGAFQTSRNALEAESVRSISHDLTTILDKLKIISVIPDTNYYGKKEHSKTKKYKQKISMIVGSIQNNIAILRNEKINNHSDIIPLDGMVIEKIVELQKIITILKLLSEFTDYNYFRNYDRRQMIILLNCYKKLLKIFETFYYPHEFEYRDLFQIYQEVIFYFSDDISSSQ